MIIKSKNDESIILEKGYPKEHQLLFTNSKKVYLEPSSLNAELLIELSEITRLVVLKKESKKISIECLFGILNNPRVFLINNNINFSVVPIYSQNNCSLELFYDVQVYMTEFLKLKQCRINAFYLFFFSTFVGLLGIISIYLFNLVNIWSDYEYIRLILVYLTLSIIASIAFTSLNNHIYTLKKRKLRDDFH